MSQSPRRGGDETLLTLLKKLSPLNVRARERKLRRLLLHSSASTVFLRARLLEETSRGLALEIARFYIHETAFFCEILTKEIYGIVFTFFFFLSYFRGP